MDKKKLIKSSLIGIIVAAIIGGAVVFFMFNQPARDVQSAKTDFDFTSSQLVQEYLADADKANEKYLDEEGQSKIFEITGEVASISEDFNNQTVILLKAKTDSAGVNCTFTSATSPAAQSLNIGDHTSIKGVIRAGASYDSDLGMYENVTMEKCDLVKK